GRELTHQNDNGGSGGFGRHGAKAYQAALEAVVAIPIAGGLGYWADTRFGTDPTLLLVGLVLGFATFVVRIWRMRSLVEEASRDSERSERDER
ncbi:MAG: AtpZ/AtpI family protein, partial [Myxococcota bacterium]